VCRVWRREKTGKREEKVRPRLTYGSWRRESVVVISVSYLDRHLSRKLDGYEVRLGTIGAEGKRKVVRFEGT